MGVISSGVLAGLAKIGLVAVSIGGLSAGAYFAYQTTQGGDGGTSLQIEPTLSIGAPTATRATPTAMVDLATPDATPPVVDTSTWLTYDGPVGVSVKYPPTWVVREGANLDSLVKILNEARQDTIAPFDPASPRGAANAGDAWIEIAPGAYPEFDASGIIRSCLGNGIYDQGVSSSALQTTFAGRSAIKCVVERPQSPTNALAGRTEGYILELPSGRVLGVTAYVMGGDADLTSLLSSVLQTVILAP